MQDEPKPRRRGAFGRVRLEEQRRSGFERVIKWGFLVALVAGAAVLAPKVPGLWRQHIEGRDGDYEPEFEVNLDAVDLELVHTELLPDWFFKAQHRLELGERGAPVIDDALAKLKEAVAPDGNLQMLVSEMDAMSQVGAMTTPQAEQHALWFTRAWNQYLDANDKPYFIRAFIIEGTQSSLVVYNYKVIGEGAVELDGSDLRVRILDRIERMNEYVPYHASDGREVTVVLAGQLVPFAARRIWPLLGASEPKSRRARLYREAIVAEAKLALSETHFATLAATADVRAAATEARSAMRDRYSSCHATFTPGQPWRGFDDEQLAKLEARAEGGRCPVVYPRELEALRALSKTAAENPELEAAFAAMLAWLAEPATIHQARHYEDRIEVWNPEADVVCKICSGNDGPETRAEVSALLAEWTWTKNPATAMYAACWDDERDETRAAEVIFEELKWSCSEGPHPDLRTAGRELEETGFDRDEPIEVTNLPAILPAVLQ